MPASGRLPIPLRAISSEQRVISHGSSGSWPTGLVTGVHGACIGAGLELAAYSGRVIAGVDTQFRLPEVQMGLLPGSGGTVSVPRRAGRQRSLWLMISGETIDAGTALEWGLVDELVGVTEVVDRVRATAIELLV